MYIACSVSERHRIFGGRGEDLLGQGKGACIVAGIIRAVLAQNSQGIEHIGAPNQRKLFC